MKVGFVVGLDFHEYHLNPIRLELGTRGHDIHSYKAESNNIVTVDDDCDVFVIADQVYGKCLPPRVPIVQTFHGMFGGGGYYSHRGHRKTAMFLSSGPALTDYLRDQYPHHLVVATGCTKLDSYYISPHQKVPGKTVLYSSHCGSQFRTFPMMISALHRLQDEGWLVKVTLHALLRRELEAKSKEHGWTGLDYVREHFHFLEKWSPIDLAYADVVLAGYTSLVYEAFVLGTPIVLLERGDAPIDQWPLYKQLMKLVPVAPVGHEDKISWAVNNAAVTDGLAAEELRQKLCYPLDGKAAHRAADAIEAEFL